MQCETRARWRFRRTCDPRSERRSSPPPARRSRRLGYTRASIDAIAAAAEVSTRTIYKHFANKEELFATVLEASATEVADAFVERARIGHRRRAHTTEERLLALGPRDRLPAPRPPRALRDGPPDHARARSLPGRRRDRVDGRRARTASSTRSARSCARSPTPASCVIDDAPARRDAPVRAHAGRDQPAPSRRSGPLDRRRGRRQHRRRHQGLPARLRAVVGPARPRRRGARRRAARRPRAPARRPRTRRPARRPRRSSPAPAPPARTGHGPRPPPQPTRSMLGRISANSSPPSRATASSARTSPCSVCATHTSSSSPAGWPCVSLTALKPTRSKSTSPTRPSVRASSAAERSENPSRFRQPVSGSVREMRSRCSVRRGVQPRLPDAHERDEREAGREHEDHRRAQRRRLTQQRERDEGAEARQADEHHQRERIRQRREDHRQEVHERRRAARPARRPPRAR